MAEQRGAVLALLAQVQYFLPLRQQEVEALEQLVLLSDQMV
jgi:hypothetical protein